MFQFNKEQLTAVKHVNGPMLVLAGPGSGKTQVIVGRVLNLILNEGIDPSGILVLTFSRSAAQTMEQRFIRAAGDDYPVSFGTFHAIFYHIIKSQGLYRDGTILTHEKKKQFIWEAVLKAGLSGYRDSAFAERMIELINLKKSGILNESSGISDEENVILTALYDTYVSIYKKEGFIDFDDMINDCLKILKGNKKILRKWQDRYRYILVDEFQDIDERQYEVLKLLTMKDKNLFCVGDDDQSIYSFRGSNPLIMHKMPEDFKDTQICTLRINYRCPGNVIDHSAKLIRANTARFKKEQISCDDKNGTIVYKCISTADEEADLCLEMIKMIGSLDPDGNETTGILYRTSGSADRIEDRLRRSMIHYERYDAHKEDILPEWLLDINAYLNLACAPDPDDMARILNRPERMLSRECLFERFPDRNAMALHYPGGSPERKALLKLFEDIDRIGTLDGYGALIYMLHISGLGAYISNTYFKERRDEYDRCIERLLSDSHRFKTVWELKEYIASGASLLRPDNKNFAEQKRITVKMMTIHASKGLEFDNVIVSGLQEGIFPGKRCVSKSDLEEERRLFYVAITRCSKRLWLIGRQKDSYGKTRSRFLKEAGFTESADVLANETVGSMVQTVL
ncbi:MAG: ATP-dependent helicase [Lachnospiraceae bacterium]|nr:ATP-dependent helicase [Lachnospiraceae bacterium]